MSDQVEDWVFESVIQFLQSPLWTSQVMTFIDEHCVAFDVEDENKLVYTEIHEKFKELVEALLETHLNEMGVSPDQFAQACARGAGNKANDAVLNHILAVDDFLTFRKLMVKRNVELNHEALSMWHNKQNAHVEAMQKGESPPDALDEDEESQLREALRLSEAEYKKHSASGNALDADQQAHLDEALRASMADIELQKALEAKEQADLEHAIAMSLALEEERNAKARGAESSVPVSTPANSLPGSSSNNPVVDPPPSKPLPPVPSAPIVTPSSSRPVDPASPLPPVSGQSHAEKLKEEQLRKLLAARKDGSDTNPEVLAAKARLEAETAAKEAELKRIAEEHKAARAKAAEAQPAPAAPAAKSAPVLPAAAPPSSKNAVDEELLRQRQAFLRAQRDKLVKAKAAERQRELDIYQAQKARETGKETSVAPPVSISADYNPATDPANKLTGQDRSPTTGMSEADKKRMEMRLALARRMKMDMVEQESCK